ncbi:YVTN family beta-propeller repeat-containing protein [uncultured Bacteroides sp.]|uniref:YVTN family beta-propeller repeat-containing protein n=1 Tax=uncultured Bacteroides sp. TaxID=162156 RepID=UPI0026295FE2|nr:YVTN family beta-propeller repeat-containing protein [uncultured Bacteroides sp.]
MRYTSYKKALLMIPAILVVSLFAFTTQIAEQPEGTPLFITDITSYRSGMIVSQKGVRKVSIYSSDYKERLQEWELDEIPTGVAADEDRIYATVAGEHKNGVYFLSASDPSQRQFVETASGACVPLVNNANGKLYVCNQFAGTVSELDKNGSAVLRTVKVLREPKAAVLDKDGKYLFVANFLPLQRADIDTVAACVSVIDTDGFRKIKDIQLANGSNALRGVSLSPDGRYLLVTHNLGRFQVPTSQLQQGWMNTNAMSVVNLSTLSFEGAVLLDEPERGAAGIWDVKCTDDKIVISHSGTHEVSVIDYPAFIRKFEAYPQKEALAYDLRFLYGLRKRVALEGNGPRCFMLKEDRAVVPTYFSDTLNVVDLKTTSVEALAMVKNRVESRIQRGEKYFNDAMHCFQNWQSCNGCHPGDARMDAMNWDLMNDGIGNSKNCKSLLFSHVTPPSMISGIRASAELAVRAGYKLIQFTDLPEEFAECVDEYLMALKPVPSPYLVNGELSEKAKRGRKVFEKFNCDECHSGPYYTDMQMHRIGDDIEFEKGWDTPTLCEVWRTAPYLFDGRAATMEEVFTVHKHGIEKKISAKEAEELAEYVNSL